MKAYYERKRKLGYKQYNIFDRTEIIKQVQAFYRNLKGLPPITKH